MKILSLDQSTIKTGWAVFEDSNLVAHGVIDLSKEKDGWVRMQMMRQSVDSIVREHMPNDIILEGIAMQRNVQTLIELGRLQGMLMASGFSRDIPCVLYLPTTWRKILKFSQGAGVKREELKKQSMNCVKNAYGIEPGEDEAEAIAIGLAHLKKMGIIE